MIKYFKIFILLIAVTSCLEEKPKDNIKYPPIKEREFQTLNKKNMVGKCPPLQQ